MSGRQIVLKITDEDGRTLTVISGAARDHRGTDMRTLLDDMLVSFAEGQDVELHLDWPADSTTVEKSHV